MPLPRITVEGRLAADPELRFTPGGKAVCNVRLVASQQKKNDAGEWVDDKTLWLDATVWEQTGEHVANSLQKGELVVVTGRLETQEWEDKEGGGKRQKPHLVVDSIGPSLRFRDVPHNAGRSERSSAPPASDPWASGDTPAPPAAPGSGEPPF
jgi:single-strand DNA-binding protein